MMQIISLGLDEKRIFLFFTIPVFVLLFSSVAHDAAMHMGIIAADQKIWLLDVDAEVSIYTWWSSLLLFVSSVLLCIIALGRRSDSDDFWRHWAFLSGVFLLLSADEALSFHEKVGGFLQSALDTSGLFFFAWTIPAIVLLMVGLVLYLPFLRALGPRERNLMLLSAAIFVSGAVGVEMFAGSHFQDNGFTFQYRLMANLEEGLEGFGICLFIFALLEMTKGTSLNVETRTAKPVGYSRLKGSCAR